MTSNSSIDYSLEMNSTHLLEVKYNAPSDDPSGLSNNMGDYLSENQQQALWQGFTVDEVEIAPQALSEDDHSGYDVPQSTVNLGDTLAAFADWIASINDLMGVVALGAANEAQASTNYALEESEQLNAALTGDAWNDDWAADSSSDHEGTGFETGYYVPGIDSIPPDVTGPDNEDYTAYWQTTANENYQQIQTTYTSWVSETQSWAQRDADLVNNLSTNTQNYYDIIGSINDIMNNIQQLTTRPV